MNTSAALAPVKAIAVETISRWNPWLTLKNEKHLEYTVWYTSANGSSRWCTGTVRNPEALHAPAIREEVLKHLTSFVQENWIRMEVCKPNRDSFGNLHSGYIQDTGMLLITRETRH